MRTLATMEIAGLLERYSGSFNLDAYRRHRSMFFAELLGSRDPFHKEIIQFSRQRNYPYPIASRLLHALRIHSLASFSDRILRKLKQPPMNP